jgi:polar amino acid transport system substrate-binding protein
MIRAAINVGNPALAREEPDGSLSGLSVTLARAFGDFAGHPVELVRFASAGSVVEAQAEDAWDIAFLAVDPKRAEQLHFTEPYLTIEASYAVAADSGFASVDDVDRHGVRIASSRGAAYDLHLERTLRHAERVVFPSPAASQQAFAGGGLDALAGVRLALQRFAAVCDGVRILPDSFATIAQAMATPVGRRETAALLDAFVARAIATGSPPAA